ncbi:MAG: MogA/MoaB family molybdenum cofactor biosynthesis protein [Gemmatimonadota bacterium]
MRVAVLTISDGVSRGERTDDSGDAIEAWVREQGGVVAARSVVPDEAAAIRHVLADWADADTADVVLTTGGTGLTDRDVTPEATADVLERAAPGFGEALRSAGAVSTPYSWLSRGVAGTRRRTLIINLPGSTSGVRDGLRVLAPLLPHAVQLIRGQDTQHHDG